MLTHTHTRAQTLYSEYSHTYMTALVKPGKAFFRGKTAQLFPFTAQWSCGCSPELDVNLLTLQWFSSALNTAVQLLHRRALLPSMFYAQREGGRKFLCATAGSLFSCHAYFIGLFFLVVRIHRIGRLLRCALYVCIEDD